MTQKWEDAGCMREDSWSAIYKGNTSDGHGCRRSLGRLTERVPPRAESWNSGGPRVDNRQFFVQFSCMGKTITIDDDAYKLLSALKRRPGDSFTKVILRHLNRPADTGGELLEAMEKLRPPDVDLAMLKRIERERGKRSGGRK